VRDKLYEMNDVERLFRFLSKRKDWKKIPSAILLRLIENAKAAPRFPENPLWPDPATQLIQRFVEISEVFGLIRGKWTFLTKKWSPKGSPEEVLAEVLEVLDYFSSILEDLAYQLFDEATNNIANGKRTRNFGPHFRKTVEEAPMFGKTEFLTYLSAADIAYQLAIVCAPLNLANYVSLAGFYFATRHIDWAREACTLYDQAEERILNTEDALLSPQGHVYKEDHDSMRTKLRENIESMRTQLSNSTG